MSERLNTVLEDGRLEQVRRMAGGQRKVGAFLSDVIRFLATYESLVTTRDFQDLCILERLRIDALPEIVLDELEDNYERWRREMQDTLDATRREYSALMVRVIELEKQQGLAP